MVKANDVIEAMEPGKWNDIKRVHDEAERILCAPYDVSLKVSYVYSTLSTIIFVSPICFCWKDERLMVLKRSPSLSVFNAHGRNHSQKFRDLLSQISQDSLELWSESNLCQTDGLAVLIVDSIEQSPYSIELLQILCTLIGINLSILQIG